MKCFEEGSRIAAGGDDDNPGLRRFAQLLRGHAEPIPAEPSPVFGCPLVTEHPGNQRGAYAQALRTAR